MFRLKRSPMNSNEQIRSLATDMHYELKGPITFCLYTALHGFKQVYSGLQAVYMELHVKLCK